MGEGDDEGAHTGRDVQIQVLNKYRGSDIPWRFEQYWLKSDFTAKLNCPVMGRLEKPTHLTLLKCEERQGFGGHADGKSREMMAHAASMRILAA